MKIRDGFISNSSSTSFVLAGWIVDSEQLVQIAHKLLPPKQFADLDEQKELTFKGAVFDHIYDKLKELDPMADFWTSDWSEGAVGITIFQLSDEEGFHYLDSLSEEEARRRATDLGQALGMSDKPALIGGVLRC